MKRILFVDDEQNVLDGLRNILRKQRKEWDMVFALGGLAALEELEKGHFDVVVSDMRMPGMDGATLLAKVRDRYPSTARIVLSGHAEHDAVIRALPVMHQFLHKPCEVQVLRSVIDRTCGLAELLRGEVIRRAVGKLDRLPSPPSVYMSLTQALADPFASARDIAKIVEGDPAMSAKILQLVHSAYFGLANRATTIQQAVAYLGVEVLKALYLSAHVFGTIEGSAVNGFSLDEFQRESFSVAVLAKRMIRDRSHTDDAMTAGILHDVGRIVLAVGMPEAFCEVQNTFLATGRPLHVIEREHLGVTHGEIGAYLLGVWGLPFSIVETVAYHHTPSTITEGPCDTLAAVHIADAMIHGARVREGCPLSEPFDVPFLERCGYSDELPKWQAAADEEMGRIDERLTQQNGARRASG